MPGPGGCAGAALLRRASANAGDTAAGRSDRRPGAAAPSARRASPGGHRPAPPASRAGLALRCADSGTRAVQTAPFQPCVQAPAVSITSGVSGRNSSCLPRTETGRPCTRISRRRLRRAAPCCRGSRPPGTCSSGRGCGAESRFEGRAVQRGAAAQRQLQRELAVFRNALQPADQPAGLELDLQVLRQRRGLEVGRDLQRHRQQHGAFVAVVGQRADRDLLRHRPWMSPASTPGGRVHSSRVGRPESPGFFQ